MTRDSSKKPNPPPEVCWVQTNNDTPPLRKLEGGEFEQKVVEKQRKDHKWGLPSVEAAPEIPSARTIETLRPQDRDRDRDRDPAPLSPLLLSILGGLSLKI